MSFDFSEKADIRSFARSPMYATTPLILAGIGDKFCHFIIEECELITSLWFSVGAECPGAIWRDCTLPRAVSRTVSLEF